MSVIKQRVQATTVKFQNVKQDECHVFLEHGIPGNVRNGKRHWQDLGILLLKIDEDRGWKPDGEAGCLQPGAGGVACRSFVPVLNQIVIGAPQSRRSITTFFDLAHPLHTPTMRVNKAPRWTQNPR